MKKLLTAILAAAMLMTPIASAAIRTPQGYVYLENGSVILYENEDRTDVWYTLSDIPAGETVYYRVKPDDGYYCSGIDLNAPEADEGTFVMPEGELQIDATFRLLGDADYNGKVNLDDVSMILKYIVGDTHIYWTITKKAADFNRDGKINLSDATLILQSIAGFEGVGKAPQSETGFVITHSVKTAGTASYILTDTNIGDWVYADSPLIRELNSKVIENADDLKDFTVKLMTVITEFKTVTADGSVEESDMTPYTFRELYSDEFFAEYDLVPLTVYSNRAVTVGDLRITDTFMDIDLNVHGKICDDLVFSDGSVEYTGECTVNLIAVPKNSVERWAVAGLSQDPEAFYAESNLW